MEEPEIIIRPVQTKEDVKEVVDLTLRMFPEEARATGVPTGKWRELKIEELTKTPELWPQCGKKPRRAQPCQTLVLAKVLKQTLLFFPRDLMTRRTFVLLRSGV